MQHYFVKKEGNNLYFQSSDEHHILHVMRMKNEEQVIGIVKNEAKYLAKLHLDQNPIYATIIEEIQSENELAGKVTLIYGLPKQEKFELVLQKAVELGIHEIIPFASMRSIVKISPQDESKKMIRWNNIAKEAAEQSRRLVIPSICPIQKLAEIVRVEADIKLIAYEKEANKGTEDLYQVLSQSDLQGKRICLVVGAEGGLDEKEVDRLMEAGFQSVSLGKRILRSETAAIYMMSVVSFMLERGK